MNLTALRYVWLALLATLCFLGLGTSALAQGTLRGITYEDADVSGTFSLGESPIPGVNLVVSGPSGVFFVTTNGLGQYQLNDLAPGTYTIVAPTTAGGSLLVGGGGSGTFEVNVPPQPAVRFDIGYHKECVRIRPNPKILWEIGANGQPTGNANVTFTFTNNAPFPIGWIYLTAPAGVTLAQNPIQLTPPLAPGASTSITVTMSGLQPNSEACFTFGFHSPGLEECCVEKICFKVPDCDCFQILEEEIICNPNGSFSINMVLQNLTIYNISQIWAVGPTGSNLSPNPTLVNVAPGGVVTLNWTLTGNSLAGTTFCFKVMFFNGGVRCCVKEVCVDLPDCKVCDDRPAICYAKRPFYQASGQPGSPSYNGPDWALLNGKTVSAVTCYSAPIDGFVFGFMNQDQYQCGPPVLGTDWALTPRGFHNGMDSNPTAVPPDCRWTKFYMGNVFAITFDDEGNTYVAQTSCYNADYAARIEDFNSPGTPGRQHVPSPNEIADRRLHGRIFKIANGTGKVTLFNEDTTNQWNGLPSGPDPGIVSLPNNFPSQRPEITMSSQAYPEVGDITFDYDNRQIFATSMDDGKIYRYNMSGQKLNSFDPWGADTGAMYGDGFATWGENIWAAKYHRGRVYFSRWVEDFDVFGAGNNEVWSVAINPATDDFVPSSLRFEIQTSNLTANYGGLGATATPPISDITFMNENVVSSTGQVTERACLVIAERGMGGNWAPFSSIYEQMIYHAAPTNPSNPVDAFTNTYPHRARGSKYCCDPATGTWALQTGSPQFWALGTGAGGENSSGGVDFDFDNRGCTTSPQGNRVWFTADANCIGTGCWYGLQGLLPSGGAPVNSILIDFNGLSALADKSTLGDVETPCPSVNLLGTLLMAHMVGSCEGLPVRVTLVGPSGTFEANGVLNATGEFSLSTEVPNGSYQAYVWSRSHLVRMVMLTIVNNIGNLGGVPLIPGDVNQDNEIGPADFALLSSAFGSFTGDANFLEAADLNRDGEVGPADFALLSANFGAIGDSP